MRSAAALFLLATTAFAGTAPEELAAMLLSPDARTRKLGREAIEAPAMPMVLDALAKWAHDREAWIAHLERRLHGGGTAGELTRVRGMLGDLRGSRDEHVGLDFYFVSMPKDLARKILGKGEPDVIHRPKSGAWDRWWKLVREDKRAQRLFGRAIAGIDGRPAMTESIREISYIQDMEVADEEKGLLDPVVGVVRSGVEMKWRPRIAGAHIVLGMDMFITDVVRPIRTVEVKRAGHKTRIQKPVVSKERLRKLLSLPIGGVCAFRVPNKHGDKEGRSTVVLMRAVIGQPEAEK